MAIGANLLRPNGHNVNARAAGDEAAAIRRLEGAVVVLVAIATLRERVTAEWRRNMVGVVRSAMGGRKRVWWASRRRVFGDGSLEL